MRKQGIVSRTTYYRRKRESKRFNISIMDLLDRRGQHKAHSRGQLHYRWNKGGRIRNDEYILIRVGKGHPLADPNGYAYEHHVVWWSAIGAVKFTDRQKKVGLLHHINGDRTDNRLENLSPMSKSCHNKHHNKSKIRNRQGQFIKNSGRLLDGREWNEIPKK